MEVSVVATIYLLGALMICVSIPSERQVATASSCLEIILFKCERKNLKAASANVCGFPNNCPIALQASQSVLLWSSAPQICIARLGNGDRFWQPGVGTVGKGQETGSWSSKAPFPRLGSNQALLPCWQLLSFHICTVLWPESCEDLVLSLSSSVMCSQSNTSPLGHLGPGLLLPLFLQTESIP